jgi:AcrR family transcriptional regulator
MPRAALRQDQIEDFRDSLCEVALRQFAEHGYAGVSLRRLAAELGCSPMTPYRYFRDKDEILAAVRAAAFSRFADAQERGVEGLIDPRHRLEALGKAYLTFAQREPHAYRVMFELHQNPDPDHAAQLREEKRAWRTLRDEVAAAIEAGVLGGDPDTVAHLLWAGLHGIVSLDLAGKLRLGRTFDDLRDAMMGMSFRGNARES